MDEDRTLPNGGSAPPTIDAAAVGDLPYRQEEATDQNLGEVHKNDRPEKQALRPSEHDSYNRGIGAVVDTYCHNMESIHVTLPLIMRFLQDIHNDLRTDFRKIRDAHGKIIETEEKYQVVAFPVQYGLTAERLSLRLRNLSTTRKLLPPTLLTTMVSQYDSFLSRLIATIFYLKPEMVSGSERKLTFSELMEFGTIENARSYIIEKEIEGVMRENHSKQFDWLEGKVGLKLRSDLPAWPLFIEITERRNLFTHTDGIVSTQYREVCRRHNVDIDEGAEVGQKLSVNQKYLQSAYRTLVEIGVKLVHVVWRKLDPKNREEADQNLNKICFDLLKRADYELAKVLLDFAVGLKKWHSDLYRRMFIVNRAQAYKFGDEIDKAREILNSEDWSSVGKRFLICIETLRDNYDEASELMKELGKSREMRKEEFATWPIFKEFRKTLEFKRAYQDLYGEELTISTTADKASMEIDPPAGNPDELALELEQTKSGA
jgi:hypothetical protein